MEHAAATRRRESVMRIRARVLRTDVAERRVYHLRAAAPCATARKRVSRWCRDFSVLSATGERKTMKTQMLHSTTGLLAVLALVVWSGQASAQAQPPPGGQGGAGAGGPPRPP